MSITVRDCLFLPTLSLGYVAAGENRPVVKKNFQDRVQQLGINVSKYGGVYMYKCLKPKAFIEVEDDTVF